MRLDIGPDGKIIGTRRVSPNGQVSGLTDYAGREVLVILPGSSDAGAPPPWPNADEMNRMVGEQIRQAYDRYEALREVYATPWEATRSFMQGVFGGRTPDLMAEVDRWVESQVRATSAGASPGPAERSRAGSKTEDRPADRRNGPSKRRAHGQ